MDDTQTALGSDVMVAASEGYALMKLFGKAEGLSELQQAMRAAPAAAARATRRPAKAGAGLQKGGSPAFLLFAPGRSRGPHFLPRRDL
jgi:hypothetical protein